MKFRFNEEKNINLISSRGFGFVDIIKSINNGNILDFVNHPNQKKYPNQKVFYVKMNEEIFVVPCVIEKDGTIFLKTLFPSSKAKKLFNNKNHEKIK